MNIRARMLLVLLAWTVGGMAHGQVPAAVPVPGLSTNVAAFLPINASLYTSMDALDDTQRLGPGDRVSYRVLEDREEPKPLLVTDSGELEVPYLGRVKAADKTCKQVAQQVKEALEKDLYYQATVIVAIDLLNRKRGVVYIVGQVRNAGVIELPSDEALTLSKAILRAGGFGEFANKKRVRVTRGGANNPPTGASASGPPLSAPGTKPIEVDVGEILEGGRADHDIKLESGDLIFVPSKLINF